jgi:FkbM family methyltransferase
MIFLHHIGARNGARGFPIVSELETNFCNVLYDADANCLEQVKEKNSKLKSRLIVFDYCVAKKNGKGEFYLNSDPYTSSIYKKNDFFDDALFYHGTTDYLIKDTLMCNQILNVDFVTLDYVLELHPELAFDFLSLDVQGAELDILMGARNALKDNLGLMVEGSFIDFYQKQPLFSKVFDYLCPHYILCDIGKLERGALIQSPVGFRGIGVPISADFLFLRRPETIINSDLDAREKKIQLNKLAFISIILFQFEIALQALGMASNIDSQIPLDENYIKINQKIWSLVEHLQTFGSRYRLSYKEAQELKFSSQAELGKKIEKRSFDIRLKGLILRKWLNIKNVAHGYFEKKYSPLEKELIKFGLSEQAKLLRKRRLEYILKF